MKRTHRRIIIIVLLIAAVAGIVLVSQTGRKAPDQEAIRIGLILPLSGDAAAVGVSAKNAALLAQADLGKTRNKYELLFEDDQAEAKKTVSAFQKFKTENIGAVVAAFSGPSAAVAPLGEQERVITFTIASDMTIAKEKKFVFNHWIKPENEAEVFVEEAKRRGLKKIAILATNQQGVVAVRDALLHKDSNLFLLKEDLIQESDKDFRTPILKAKQLGADSFLLLLLPGQFAAAVKQIREAGMGAPITGIESFEYDTEAVPLLEGQWYVNADDPSNEFIETYQKQFNALPQIGAGNTYDIVQLLMMAFEREGINPEKVAEMISETKNFRGVMGALSVDADGNIDSQAVVKEIRNGKFVKVTR